MSSQDLVLAAPHRSNLWIYFVGDIALDVPQPDRFEFLGNKSGNSLLFWGSKSLGVF